MCLGITFVIHAIVGVSPTDMAVLSITYALNLDSDGYSLVLTIFNLTLLLIAIIMYLIKIKLKKSKFYYTNIIYFLSQLVPTFAVGPIIVLFQNWFVLELNLENQVFWIRFMVFLVSWIILCMGTSLMVWTQIMQQSANSIVLDMTVIFNIKFMTARMIYDGIQAAAGIAICLIWDPERIWNILNIGTIFLVFLTGPLIHIFLNWIKKTKII